MNKENEIKEKLAQALQMPIIEQALARLRKELPQDLYYHTFQHSEDVLHEVIKLATLDNLDSNQITLLAIAAAYHDIGYIRTPMDNERFGAEAARQAMLSTGLFEEKQILLVEQMILDTRLQSSVDGLRQIPSSTLAGYLLDADMSNLGREDFVEKLELIRRELGFERILFLRRTLDLISNHRWHTKAAQELRAEITNKNIQTAKELLQREELTSGTGVLLGTERLSFLARLPILLNSSFSVRDVVERSLDHLKSRLFAQAATVFILDRNAQQLTFWALRGGQAANLAGQKMPAEKGVVGWVIKHNQSALINDVTKDKRFFSVIDHEGSFVTKNMVCAPLSVRGEPPFGAIQALNREAQGRFTEEDLQFIEQFAAQISLSLDNAILLEKLKDRTHALEVLEKRKNDVITLVSHEFRTPLNVIQNAADLLTYGLSETAEERIKIGETLGRGVDRLSKLISQIRNVALIGSDNLVLVKEEFSLTEMLKKSALEFQSIFKDRNISFQEQIKEDVVVNGDLALLRLVMRNLISNSIRFTPDHGSVTLSLICKSGMAVVAIRDTGIGIESDKVSLLTEKFYEVVDAMNHSSGDFQVGSNGLGLGLSAATTILKAHSSALEIESELGKGSTFGFRLALP